MKSLKGGYLLLSLGMIAIASITHLDVSKVKDTSKRIVLTDLTLDGVERLNDLSIAPQRSGTNIIFKNVYGYDLTIDEDGNVTVSQYASGLKIYKHELHAENAVISTFGGKTIVTISGYILSLDPTPITLTQLFSYGVNPNKIIISHNVRFSDWELLKYLIGGSTETLTFIDNQTGTVSNDGLDLITDDGGYSDTVSLVEQGV